MVKSTKLAHEARKVLKFVNKDAKLVVLVRREVGPFLDRLQEFTDKDGPDKHFDIRGEGWRQPDKHYFSLVYNLCKVNRCLPLVDDMLEKRITQKSVEPSLHDLRLLLLVRREPEIARSLIVFYVAEKVVAKLLIFEKTGDIREGVLWVFDKDIDHILDHELQPRPVLPFMFQFFLNTSYALRYVSVRFLVCHIRTSEHINPEAVCFVFRIKDDEVSAEAV